MDYGHDDTGKVNIGGLKLGEQSLVQTLNAQVKFKHGRVSEAVVFNVQTSTHANRAHGGMGCGVEVLDCADENSDHVD